MIRSLERFKYILFYIIILIFQLSVGYFLSTMGYSNLYPIVESSTVGYNLYSIVEILYPIVEILYPTVELRI